MELLGVEIATNEAATILKELHMKIDSVTFFCDNVSVLYWILHRTNGTRWVEHRLKKIRTTLGSINQDNLKTSLRYIPADQNPAEIATRGCSVLELKASKMCRCTICKKRHGRAYKYPFAKTIPRTRTEAMIPFAHIGIDYFGPIKHKTTNAETNQTGIGKMWVFLATCIVTRAVHLECVMDNSTRQLLLALRRFVARRGAPETILSDNAPTFVLGLKMINTNVVEFVNQSRTLTNYLASKEIAVKQITPYSPWQGGIYERIVGIVKSCLYKIIGPANLTFLELETIIIECEGTVNNRPITL
uniref:Integrase catalytic domain-containing protein n=1 Tax=Caenorhabditis japonica TaxID=281687 RepID=A0A8R1ILM3_CAEJA